MRPRASIVPRELGPPEGWAPPKKAEIDAKRSWLVVRDGPDWSKAHPGLGFF